MVARGFATWKIHHKEDSPHIECDREFERKRQTNVCNSANVEDSPHNDNRLGSGGWVRKVEGVEVGGLGQGGWGRGVGGVEVVASNFATW